MLFILHVVMKTLDKTCCHVYIYDQCLYDNMTIVGMVMNKEQALEAIKKKIELESELEILMHELTPSDWAGLSICVDKLNAYLDELEAEYSDD